MVFERIARTFRLGKWRYFAGYDLQGNRYFELPHPLQPGSTKRTVDYRIKKEWSEYGFDSIPVQWSAWLRRTRRLPPTLEELQQDVIRQQRLQQEVAKLQAAYEAEKAAALAEAEKVAQLDAPRRKPATASSTSQSQAQTERQRTPYPSHDNPAIVPDSTAATGHPPSQEFGANVPKAKPKEGVFPGMAEDSPERHQMAAALDEAADINLGKSEKERQIKQGKVEQVPRGKASKRLPDAPATPTDTFEPESWSPRAARRR